MKTYLYNSPLMLSISTLKDKVQVPKGNNLKLFLSYLQYLNIILR